MRSLTDLMVYGNETFDSVLNKFSYAQTPKQRKKKHRIFLNTIENRIKIKPKKSGLHQTQIDFLVNSNLFLAFLSRYQFR